MNLYEIDNRLNMLEQYMVDAETGEMVSEEDFAKKFDEIHIELDKKIENTVCYIKNLESDIKQIADEEKNLANRRKSKENFTKRLKDNIDRYIRQQFTTVEENGNIKLDEKGLNKYKFETPKCLISYRKSQTTNITDDSKIPTEFIETKTTTTIDKNKLKKYLKTNTCDGAVIETNINMQIK